MKKLYAFLITALLFGSAQAQERVVNRGTINHNDNAGTTRENKGFGVKGGVLFNTLRGEDNDYLNNIKSATNWHAGIYTQFSLSNVFSIQPEALYSRREVKSEDATMPDRRFDYIEVPLLLGINFTDNISIHLGPQAGLMLTAKEDGKEIDKAGFNTFDYGASAGAEVKLFIFRVGGRYYRSFADLGKDDASAAATASWNDVKSGNFQIYLGVGF